MTAPFLKLYQGLSSIRYPVTFDFDIWPVSLAIIGDIQCEFLTLIKVNRVIIVRIELKLYLG